MNQKIDWKIIKKIFFVGIKGVGMMPLSIIAKEYGFEVAGSDLNEEFITDEVLIANKIKVFDFKIENIEEFFKNDSSDSCLVITTGAHSGYDNPQVKWAKGKGIVVYNQGEALSIFMNGAPFGRELKGITVTGSHGKTTVSAMISSAFVSLGLDPSYAVGTSQISPIGYSGHYGIGEYFIAEGDEYVGEPVYDRTPKILYQKPNIVIINNIDFDHPDVYKDLNDVKDTILKFINNMKDNGLVLLNSDDLNLKDLESSIRDDLEVVFYGSNNSDYSISDINSIIGSIKFTVVKNNIFFGNFESFIPGKHNVYNMLAAITLLDKIGFDLDKIKKATESYRGCKRRMEKIGVTKKGQVVIDDYGHHPFEIKSTLKALKDFYGKRIVCVFQSHTYSRTKEFLNEFANSFGEVDELILLPIFKSQRDTESDIISSNEFADAFRKKVENVYMAKSIEDASSYIEGLQNYDNEVVVTIGAGEVYKVGYKLII